MSAILTITSNLGKGVRRETLNGRAYLVAPVTLLVPGVLNGSEGPLYYPPEEVGANPTSWNGMPMVVYHPLDPLTNKAISARHPSVLAKSSIGSVYNVNTNPHNGKLQGEGWFDVEMTQRIDQRVYDSLNAGKPIEVSTGLYLEQMVAPPNAVYNSPSGKSSPYTHVARNYRPDHLAILPDQRGACAISDGCGVLINEETPDVATTTETLSVVDNVWSDAARKAAAEARKASAHAHDSSPDHLSSEQALSHAIQATGRSGNSGRAMHKMAIERHQDAANSLRGSHPEAAAAHDEAVKKHKEAIKARKDPESHPVGSHRDAVRMSEEAVAATGKQKGTNEERIIAALALKEAKAGNTKAAEAWHHVAASKHEEQISRLSGAKGTRHEKSVAAHKDAAAAHRIAADAHSDAESKGEDEPGLASAHSAALYNRHIRELAGGASIHGYTASRTAMEGNHARAAEAHELAAEHHERAGDTSYAEEHRQAAARHRALVANKETSVMNKEQLIDYIVTNCDCWKEAGDREVLNALPTAKLKRLKDKTEETITVNRRKVTPVLNDCPDGMDPDEWESMDEGQRKTHMEKMNGPTDENAKKDRKEEKGKTMTKNVNEWLAEAPPEIQSVVTNAMAMEAQAKKQIVDQLTNNDERKKVLMTLSLNDLRDRLQEAQEFAGRQQKTQGVIGSVLNPGQFFPPSYIGAAGGPIQNTHLTQNSEVDENDILELPTINWAEEALPPEGRRRKAE